MARILFTRRYWPDYPPPIKVVNVTWSKDKKNEAIEYCQQLRSYQYSKRFDRDGEQTTSKGYVEHLLDIFEEHPEMPYTWAVWKELPLLHMLEQGPCVDLELHIKRFQRICGPENFVKLLETHNGNNYYPIHAACVYTTGGIIEYLLEQNPGSIHYARTRTRYDVEEKPLASFLKRNDNLDLFPFSTWRTLIDLDPKGMQYCENIFSQALIMNWQNSPEFFEFMVDRYPIELSPNIYIGKYYEYRERGGGMTTERVEALSLHQITMLCDKALPRKLQSLDLFCHKGIETEGLRHLMGTLSAGSSSLKHLGLPIVVTGGGTTHTQDSPLLPVSWVDWFCGGLEKAGSLESLDFRFGEATVPTVQSWFHGLRDAFTKLEDLKHAKLYFHFKNQQTSSDTLFWLDSQGGESEEEAKSKAKSSIYPSWESSEEEVKSSSGLTSHNLKFKNCDICDEEMVKLVNQQICLFGSSRVRMKGSAPKSAYRSNPNLAGHVTRFLTLLSSTNEKLEKIEADSCMVEMPAFLVYLKTNNTIKVFRNYNDIDDDFDDISYVSDDVDIDDIPELRYIALVEAAIQAEYDVDKDVCRELLKNDNVTLTELHPWRKYDSDGVMTYYLDLNQAGRGKVRNATRGELVDLLCRVKAAEWDGIWRKEMHPQFATENSDPFKFATEILKRDDTWVIGNLYGLLREAPSQWASISSTVCGKRKREDVTSTASTLTKKPSTTT